MKPDDKPPRFTPRETQIMTLVANGKTSPEISDLLSLKETTVKTYLRTVRKKVNAKNKTHAIAIAVTLGLIAAVHPTQLHTDKA